ncbi:hypothetical protein ACOBQX_11620 [Actinokineospora sp. G85]|uniref:hypothetical protein n=1 Tax=Actinokineospora sp. G85 TaxID=3406626 RepID=UPI003C71CB0F
MSENLDSTGPAAAGPSPHGRALLTLAGAMFRYALWPSLATAVLGVVLFGVLRGGPGLVGALIGGALAIVSSLATLALMRATADLGPHFGLAASMGGMILKLALLTAVMLPMRGVEAVDSKALAITMIAVVLVTAAAEAIAFRKTKLPTIIPSSES